MSMKISDLIVIQETKAVPFEQFLEENVLGVVVYKTDATNWTAEIKACGYIHRALVGVDTSPIGAIKRLALDCSFSMITVTYAKNQNTETIDLSNIELTTNNIEKFYKDV